MAADEARPHRIGAYAILDVLGEGGMGIVYLAEQLEPVRRIVALKVLSQAGASEIVLARFEAERQALAVMDHPSIAKVFDAGVTERGLPYFVMERVEGSTILRYCNERRLSIRQRVALFADVCRAVQHAHQKGVIHRDLKPSNIMVSDVDGRALPRIIDFGIAKAVASDESEGSRLTRDDQVVGTPVYMSPEQITMSGDVDTRTDIYSLGVVLYELMVGSLPYDDEAYRGWAAVAAHLTGEPPTLGQRLAELGDTQRTVADLRGTTPSLLRRQLRGDLGWIVAQAMARDRNERYETANGLALDLERHLAWEPVRARGASASYRMRRFILRNRAVVGLGTLLGMGLVAFAATMTAQAGRIARARDEAQARRGQAEGLIDFMLGDLRAKLEPIGRLELLDDVGRQAVAYFAALPEDQLTDDELQRHSQALYQIGSVRLDQGRYDEAVAAFRQSLRLAEALVTRDPDNAERLFGVSQSHYWVGYARWLDGDLDGAERDFQAYLSAAETMVLLVPNNLDYRLEVGYAHSNLGTIQEDRGDLDGAVKSFQRTLEVNADLVQRDPSNLDWLGELSEEHNKLAVVYRKQGKYKEALQEHRREVRLKEKLLGMDPTHAYWRRRLAWAESYLGDIELSLGDLPASVASYGAALAIADSLATVDPSNASIARAQMVFRVRRARALSLSGRQAESLVDFRTGVVAVEGLVQRAPDDPQYRGTLGWARMEHALALVRAGQPRFALQEAEAARALLDSASVEDREDRYRLAWTDLARGAALEMLGRGGEATVAREAGVRLLDELVAGPGGEEYRPGLAEALLALGRDSDATLQIDILRSQGYGGPIPSALPAGHGPRPSG